MAVVDAFAPKFELKSNRVDANRTNAKTLTFLFISDHYFIPLALLCKMEYKLLPNFSKADDSSEKFFLPKIKNETCHDPFIAQLISC
jgi:hypothetical protein